MTQHDSVILSMIHLLLRLATIPSREVLGSPERLERAVA